LTSRTARALALACLGAAALAALLAFFAAVVESLARPALILLAFLLAWAFLRRAAQP
jgi:fucose permease